MKYMQNGGFQTQPLMRLTLLWTTVFLSGLWLTNFFFYFSKMGWAPSSVVAYYCGSEAQFTQPRSFESMLEVTHFHLPMMAIVILLLTHLMIFSPWSHRLKVSFISATFGTALLEEGSGWLVRFVHPSFAILKVFSFLAFQILFAILLGALLLFLIPAPTKKAHSAKRGH